MHVFCVIHSPARVRHAGDGDGYHGDMPLPQVIGFSKLKRHVAIRNNWFRGSHASPLHRVDAGAAAIEFAHNFVEGGVGVLRADTVTAVGNLHAFGGEGLVLASPLSRVSHGCPEGAYGEFIKGPMMPRGQGCVRRGGGGGGQRAEEQGTWAAQTHSEAGYGRPVDRGVWTAKTVKRPRQQPAHPQYANYWAPLTRKRHIPPHSAQPRYTNHWAPRTRKRHRQEHRPLRSTESSDPTQHAKGRTGDCPGPRKETTTRRNVTQGGGGGLAGRVPLWSPPKAGQQFWSLNPLGTEGAEAKLWL